LNVSMDNTDIFITHLHSDHSGLAPTIMTDNTRVYCSQKDGEILSICGTDYYWNDLAKSFIETGLKLSLHDAINAHPGYKFRPKGLVNYTFVKDGDVLSVGDYNFKCIETPGHTPGHMCLYDEKEKIFFSGDHILGDITPVICIERGFDMPLTRYLESLKKVEKLDIETVLVGHRNMLADIYQRIKELQQHHKDRLNEVFDILKKGPADAYEAAQSMSWDISCDTWDEFPPAQKWFATGEAFAHLQHLWHIGKLKKHKIGGRYLFETLV
ncbi:MAG TPA: MBL fold metallo-hydrolase, partial [Anaerovoracaceae bacterium]|nr:MBL fold metallo-hydrolase [Anaerovoracaceae bacterium]